MRSHTSILLAAVLSVAPSLARAEGPFVVAHDDGSLAALRLRTQADFTDLETTLLALYQQSGAPVPEVLSVWTTFPVDGNVIETRFLPIGNDLTGIGLETYYTTAVGADPGGTFASFMPPLRGVLMHNDITQIATRAAAHHAPVDGYARYLFLLELSHTWGPAIQLGSTPDDELIAAGGFHWSFWMDAGGSPSGGNVWHDNGDGTFTAQTPAPSQLQYSMLDLYLMGLAASSEVPPFAVLENAMPPASAHDPLTRDSGVTKDTFPWFDRAALTVPATRRTLTMDEVLARNGMRSPAYGTAPTTLHVGFMLVVAQDASDQDVLAAEAAFSPIAASFAPAYHEATHQRGTMDVVTSNTDPLPADAGTTDDASAPGDTGMATETGTTMHAGCSVARAVGAKDGGLASGAMLACVLRASRRRRRVR